MIQRAIVLLLLFGAAIHIPAAFVAAEGGRWLLAGLYGLVVLVLAASAVVYAALVVSGRVDDD